MSWKRVRGHELPLAAFQRMVESGRLGHAFLLLGPHGVGKRLFGTTLAQSLLCQRSTPQHLDSCGQCDSCVLFAAGTHPDFIFAARPEESLEIPIETVRELCRGFVLKPARGLRKIALLDDADDLNEESANCFLKTLEEPPPGALLLLIGTNIDRQLPTIKSRCQIMRFAPLPSAVVGEILTERGVADVSLRRRLVSMCEGSPGRALALSEPALWNFHEHIIESLVRTPLDSVRLAKDWVRFLEEAGKDGPTQRRRANSIMGILIDTLNHALRSQHGEAAQSRDPNISRLLQSLGVGADSEVILEVLDAALEATLQIDRRAQLVLVIEAFLERIYQILRIAALK